MSQRRREALRGGPAKVLALASCLVAVGLLGWVLRAAPIDGFHTRVALAGSSDRLRLVQDQVPSGRAARALGRQSVFALSWLVPSAACWVGARHWVPAYRRRQRAWPWLWLAGLLAVAANLVGNAVSYQLFVATPPAPAYALVGLATLSWLTIVAYAVSALGVGSCVLGPLVAPVLRPVFEWLFSGFDWLAKAHLPATAPGGAAAPAETPGSVGLPGSLEPDPQGLGIALSGGGIRAAAISAGALGAFDGPPAGGGRSVLLSARWLTAVSGGGFCAAGWRVSDHAVLRSASSRVSTTMFEQEHPWAQTVRRRRRFLENPLGGITGGALQALWRSTLVLAVVAASAYLAGWAVGSVVRSPAVHPEFSNATELWAPRTVWPWLLPLGVAAVSASLAGLARHRFPWRRRGLAAAAGLAGAGLVLLVVLLAAPIAIKYGEGIWERLAAPSSGRGDADRGSGIFGLASSLGLLGALAAALRSQAKRRWLYLGGALLAVGWVILAGKVADAFARGQPSWATERLRLGELVELPWCAWLVVVIAVAFECAPAHRLTLGGLYRKRLAGTFALRLSDPSPTTGLRPLRYEEEPAWDAFVGLDGPELILCATAHSTRRGPGGMKGFALTFRPSGVTLFRPDPRGGPQSWSLPIARYPRGSWWRGFPRGWIITRGSAISGAAFASAMGRQALGTTNALLAATNLRLGMWVPNPRWAEEDFAGDDPSGTGPASRGPQTPRVGLSYLVKEIFGCYDVDRDPFIYAADGGHRENLGLVELLRERPERVLCVDSSGDRPGSFTTFLEAIELAQAELGVTIEVAWDPVRHNQPGDLLDGVASSLPSHCATTATIRYPGGAQGLLIYGRYQPCLRCSAATLAFFHEHPPFPYYPTSDQFLTEDEYDQLVALGGHVGREMLALLEDPVRS